MTAKELLKEARKGRKELERLEKKLKKEERKRERKASNKNKDRAKKIFSTIGKVLSKVDEIEENGISVTDIIDLGGDIAKDLIDNDKIDNIIDKTQDVLADGKVDLDEVIDKGGDIAKDLIKNDKIDDIIDKTQDVLEDGKVDLGEIVDNGGDILLDNIEGHEGLKDIIRGSQDILEDGKIDLDEVVNTGLDIVGEHAQNEKIKTLATSVKEILVDGKVDAGEIFGVAANVFKDEIEKAGLTDIVTKTKDFLDGITTLEELLEKGKKELLRLAKEAAKKLVEEFLNKVLSKSLEVDLIKIKHRPPRNKWGRLSMGFGLDISLKGKISGKFTGDAIQINTEVTNKTYVVSDAVLDVGFTIPVIQKAVKGVIKLEVKGNLYSRALAQLELKANKKLVLTGDLKPTTVITDYDMTAHLTIPEWMVNLWNGAAEWSFGVLDPIDGTFSRRVGKYKVFKIEVPGYKATFDMKKLQFLGGVNGNFKIEKGEDTERVIKKVESLLPW